MPTVQVATGDASYAKRLRELLSRDENCEVLLVDKPDLTLEGVILLGRDAFDSLPKPIPQPERMVVIARKDQAGLAQIFNAGVHHVVFEGDSPGTIQLAVIAAQLRSANARDSDWQSSLNVRPVGEERIPSRLW